MKEMAAEHLNPKIFPLLEYLHRQADRAHNFKHLENVVRELQLVLTSPKYNFLEEWQKNALLAGAWLHELDDKKLKFKEFIFDKAEIFLQFIAWLTGTSIGRLEITPDTSNPKKYPLTETLLAGYSPSRRFTDLTLEGISLVSCRDNHNSTLPENERWKLLLRDADRSQAIGEVGIARAYICTLHFKNPLFTASTPRCQTREELLKIVTPERFAKYQGGSESMISHFYDKLLHLNDVASGDEYFLEKAKEGFEVMVDFVLEFGRTGHLDIEYLEGLVEKYC